MLGKSDDGFDLDQIRADNLQAMAISAGPLRHTYERPQLTAATKWGEQAEALADVGGPVRPTRRRLSTRRRTIVLAAAVRFRST
jgi:hypothetical protein